jgi:hypothetical protein
MLALEFTKQFKTSQNSEMKKLFTFLIVSTLMSCNSPYREVKSIDEINGVWKSNLETLTIDVEEMLIKSDLDSIHKILTYRHYDKSKITVSKGSVFFYDARVFIKEDGSAINIYKENTDAIVEFQKLLKIK